MMFTTGLMTSSSDSWATPQWLFDELNTKYHFTLDAAASDENHKCDRYYTVKEDGLTQKWGGLCSVTRHTARALSIG